MFLRSRAFHGKRLRPAFRVTHVAAAAGLLVGSTGGAFAQQAAAADASQVAQAPSASASAPVQGQAQAQTDAGGGATAASGAVQTVVVTGIRHSLDTSLSLKRDAQGIVDGIVAEDMGKFPDTNLAESMQRISGVSIDRSVGEGQHVTVRGIGPDFNLVLLNGRQMPTASIEATAASNSRAFDFSNLASESIAALEVYKTSRASTPTGGLGATINIKTARPLDNPGQHASFGLKADYDQSNDRLPEMLRGSKVTPEVSGIYSNTFADGMFGLALSGSYQERNLGYNEAGVPNGWHTIKGDDTNTWGHISPASPSAITNPPGPDDIYSVPQNLLYSVNGIQRKRTNGQLTLQYKPTSSVVTTLDYTYSELKSHTRRNELSAWFNFGPSISSWTDGPVAAPTFYEEVINPATADIAMGGGEYATKNRNNSLGFNLDWKTSSKLRMDFDAHHSTATAGSDSPYGSNATIGTAEFNRGNTSVDFTHDFPVLSIQGALDPSLMQVTGSSFRNSYMKSTVDQGQYHGKFKFDDGSDLDFGAALTNVNNRSAYGFTQQDSWGGATSPADYPDSLWQPATLNKYFGSIDGSHDAALFNQFYVWDFDKVRGIAAQVGDPSHYVAPTAFTTDRRVTEKSKSAYVQYSTSWEWHLPMNMAAGLRYEKTDVTSTALVPIPTGINWTGANEYSVAFGDPAFTTRTGSYSYVLPSIDFDTDLTDQLKFRASYGETIGRPLWDSIQGGLTIDPLARVGGGTGAVGNPALKPLKSKNIDFSLEWYYAKSSYLAVGYFAKVISNYTGVSSYQASPYSDLHTPANGQMFQEAVSAGGCSETNGDCIRNYIFAHYDGVNGVSKSAGIIPGQPGDPVATFQITEPVNAASARLDGVEVNWQHMFGRSGFGVSTNYTYVNSGLKYDNTSLGDQFALPGLSDSANLVAFYEDQHYELRLAYNWRGEFLFATHDGSGAPNPVYTEPYAQLDLSAGYNFDDHLSLQFEAINLTDAYQRQHERTSQEIVSVSQTGRRYLLGLRYKF
jgi:TonB-dependent receptor